MKAISITCDLCNGDKKWNGEDPYGVLQNVELPIWGLGGILRNKYDLCAYCYKDMFKKKSLNIIKKLPKKKLEGEKP